MSDVSPSCPLTSPRAVLSAAPQGWAADGRGRREQGLKSQMTQHPKQQQPLLTSGANPAGEDRQKARVAEGISRRNCLHSDLQEKEHAETIISWEKLKPNKNLLCLLYSDNQPLCGRGFLTDRNPGLFNRISILFPTPAYKLFVYIEEGEILKSGICFWFRHILGNHVESSFVAMETFLFSSISWIKTLAFPFFCSSKGQMSLKKRQNFSNCYAE